MKAVIESSRIRRAPKAGNRSKSGTLRIGFLCLLAAAVFLSSSVASADVVLLIGPDGTVLPVGTYRLVTIPTDADQPVSEVKITVGSGPVRPPVIVPPVTPDPPKPPPDPPMPPVSAARAVIVEESRDRTPEQAAVLTDPRLTPLKKSGRLLILDQNAQDSLGQTAVELEQLDDPSLPRVLGLATDGQRSGVGVDLPVTADELLKLLESWGVR